MGPRSNERGKGAPSEKTHLFCVTLQWGRAPMSAESRRRVFNLPSGHRASMGPRSNERGKGSHRERDRGRICQLQWGRAPMSAESLTQRAYNVTGPNGFNGAALQ